MIYGCLGDLCSALLTFENKEKWTESRNLKTRESISAYSIVIRSTEEINQIFKGVQNRVACYSRWFVKCNSRWRCVPLKRSNEENTNAVRHGVFLGWDVPGTTTAAATATSSTSSSAAATATTTDSRRSAATWIRGTGIQSRREHVSGRVGGFVWSKTGSGAMAWWRHLVHFSLRKRVVKTRPFQGFSTLVINLVKKKINK